MNFFLINFHQSLQGKNISGDALTSQSVSMLLSLSAKTYCSFDLFSFTQTQHWAQAFFTTTTTLYYSSMKYRITHSQLRYDWKLWAESKLTSLKNMQPMDHDRGKGQATNFPLRAFCLVLHWSQATSTTSPQVVVQFTVQVATLQVSCPDATVNSRVDFW